MGIPVVQIQPHSFRRSLFLIHETISAKHTSIDSRDIKFRPPTSGNWRSETPSLVLTRISAQPNLPFLPRNKTRDVDLNISSPHGIELKDKWNIWIIFITAHCDGRFELQN